ncbi:unnamed protein product [Mytilus coruscus]|uniref:Reverse transcriptase domain-containing protein n=1 Tax=Mytilus coruscus TaxID=42192 RepID=A0A6J8AFC5_MYTCO|nr:unnamed protein product [Mytilus coruscus]
MGDEAAPPIIIPTNYGRIDEFDDDFRRLIQYTERLNHYFIANNIESMEKQRAILLSPHGSPKSKPSSVVQRCINSKSRQPNESVSQFVAELRQISEHCDYKATLHDMLRDRLVCGIKEDRIQRRLLAEPGLTFKKAMEGEKIDVLGKRNVTVIYNSQSVDLPITVVKGKGPSLMGRDWLHKLQLNWKLIFKIEKLSHNQEPEKDKELQDLLLSKLDNYPIPKTDDLYATLSGGKLFPRILRVVVRVDDILITGSSKSEHLNNLETVLGKIQESGMRLNKDKCVFLTPEVVYLGHRIDQYGIYSIESKVKAITEAPEPKNVTELKSYLGMLNYYNRFLPDLSSKLAPLHELLKKKKQWEWDKSQQEAFEL